MLSMARRELQEWALRDLVTNSTVAALDWVRIQEALLGTGEELWAREARGDLGAPDTDAAVDALGEAGLGLNLVLAGAAQHFGGWLLDYCVVAAAIRMRLTQRVRQYTAVHNRVYAQIAAGTREPDGQRVELSSKSQERLGNVFETLVGVWVVQRRHGHLWRLVLFLVTIVHRGSSTSQTGPLCALWSTG